MDKCSQTISDSCTKVLAAYATNSKSVEMDKLNYSSSLKYLILEDKFVSIDIMDPVGFKVFQQQEGTAIPDSSVIADARISDFLLGAERVKKQYDDIIRMKTANVGNAWLLVSTYYCAYFSCLEISKLFDRISMSFDRNDFESLANIATGQYYNDFINMKNYNFVGKCNSEAIFFYSVGAKPHAAAWVNILHCLKEIFKGKNWPESDRYIGVISDKDFSPSAIRNDWNYKRADYFGVEGEKIGGEFKKLVGNSKGASEWLRRRYMSLNVFEPCVVAVLCELLAPAVINAASNVRRILAAKID